MLTKTHQPNFGVDGRLSEPHEKKEETRRVCARRECSSPCLFFLLLVCTYWCCDFFVLLLLLLLLKRGVHLFAWGFGGVFVRLHSDPFGRVSAEGETHAINVLYAFHVVCGFVHLDVGEEGTLLSADNPPASPLPQKKKLGKEKGQREWMWGCQRVKELEQGHIRLFPKGH